MSLKICFLFIYACFSILSVAESRHTRKSTSCLADFDASVAALLPSDEMLRPKATSEEVDISAQVLAGVPCRVLLRRSGRWPLWERRRAQRYDSADPSYQEHRWDRNVSQESSE